MKKQTSICLSVCLALCLLLIFTAGLSRAQGPEPPKEEPVPEGEAGVAANVSGRIPIQGRLTNAAGTPLDGSYSIRFRLYDAAGAVLCEDTHAVTVAAGLFNTYVDNCTSLDIYGEQVFLGITVGTDAEMTERQPIYPVPYAFSLRPGAVISDTTSYVELNRYVSGPLLPRKYGLYARARGIISTGVWGESETGTGVLGSSTGGFGVNGSSTTNAGVRGVSDSSFGVFGMSETGTAIEGNSASGAALSAAGTGIIKSTARSYLWISGNGLQKANSTDSTEFQFDNYGGYRVYWGGVGGNKALVLPVTIPGQLYGQNIRVTGLDLYYKSSGDFMGISRIVIRRQNGAGTGSLILLDDTDRVCVGVNPCVQHWDLTSNNLLSDLAGILYIGIELGTYSGNTDYVQIGGARLTLEHD